jgi:hypothetical protein
LHVKKLALVGILAVAGVAASANAFEYRVRFVEQTGNGANQFTVLAGNSIDASNGAPRRIRVQFGVFDDATSAAPAGGFVGWNVGTITVGGAAGNSDESRTPGRLSPFNFAAGPNSNGNPSTNPFDALTEIDATLGTQSPIWICDAQGNVPPQPAATVRGRNTYISVYEITIDPAAGAVNYSIAYGGNLIAASSWNTVGTPTPPDCGDPSDPSDDTPGQVTYAPFPTDPVAFAATLNVVIPAPGTAALLGLGGLVALRRRR